MSYNLTPYLDSTNGISEQMPQLDDEDLSGWLWDAWTAYGVLVFAVPVAVVNIVGNFLTIIAFAIDPNLRACNHNLYITNLAVSNLGIGLVVIPMYTYSTMIDLHWGIGTASCKLFLFVDYWMCAEASLTMILIVYDRMLMIRDGEIYDEMHDRKWAIWNVAITWCLSLCIYLPGLIGFYYIRESSIEREGRCMNEFESVVWYVMLTSFLEFVIPIVTLAALLVATTGSLYRRVVLVRSSVRYYDRQVFKQEKYLTMCLCIMVLCYMICWMPYTAATMMIALCHDCVNIFVYEGFVWLLWLNTALNPFHYAHANKRIRAHFMWMLCPCRFGRVHVEFERCDSLYSTASSKARTISSTDTSLSVVTRVQYYNYVPSCQHRASHFLSDMTSSSGSLQRIVLRSTDSRSRNKLPHGVLPHPEIAILGMDDANSLSNSITEVRSGSFRPKCRTSSQQLNTCESIEVQTPEETQLNRLSTDVLTTDSVVIGLHDCKNEHV